MDRETAKVTKSFVKKIKRNYKINKIILFGSRARGDNFVNSDYDFIIVSGDFKKMRFTKRMANMYEYWNNECDIEPLCYTPEEFERKSKQIGIVKRAVMEGIEIK